MRDLSANLKAFELIKHEGQRTYNVTLCRAHVNIFAVEEQ